VNVDVIDPFADSAELEHEYGFGLIAEPASDYDAVIVAVNHRPYANLEQAYFESITADKAIFIDVKGIYRDKINSKLTYWSL
jgi:UDP-N-acetyl-D-galactosamine dehydrogenase